MPLYYDDEIIKKYCQSLRKITNKMNKSQSRNYDWFFIFFSDVFSFSNDHKNNVEKALIKKEKINLHLNEDESFFGKGTLFLNEEFNSEDERNLVLSFNAIYEFKNSIIFIKYYPCVLPFEVSIYLMKYVEEYCVKRGKIFKGLFVINYKNSGLLEAFSQKITCFKANFFFLKRARIVSQKEAKCISNKFYLNGIGVNLLVAAKGHLAANDVVIHTKNCHCCPFKEVC